MKTHWRPCTPIIFNLSLSNQNRLDGNQVVHSVTRQVAVEVTESIRGNHISKTCLLFSTWLPSATLHHSTGDCWSIRVHKTPPPPPPPSLKPWDSVWSLRPFQPKPHVPNHKIDTSVILSSVFWQCKHRGKPIVEWNRRGSKHLNENKNNFQLKL